MLNLKTIKKKASEIFDYDSRHKLVHLVLLTEEDCERLNINLDWDLYLIKTIYKKEV